MRRRQMQQQDSATGVHTDRHTNTNTTHTHTITCRQFALTPRRYHPAGLVKSEHCEVAYKFIDKENSDAKINEFWNSTEYSR
jgi:hypothetical protein